MWNYVRYFCRKIKNDFGWTIRRWMIRGSDNVFDSNYVEFLEVITCKGGTVISYNNIEKSMSCN